MPVSLIDFAVIIVYLLLTLGIGLFVLRREHLSDYLVNRRKTGFWLLLASNVSTAVGAGTIVGVAAATYTSGISYGLTFFIGFALGFCFLSMLGPKINEFGHKHGAHSLGDFFGKRYSSRTQTVVGVVVGIASLLFAAIQFVAIASVVQVLTGIDFRLGAVLAAIITIVYTSSTGIKGDIYTDFFQFIIMIILLIVLTGIALVNLDPITTLAQVPPMFFDPFAFGGIAFFIGGILLSAPYFLADMVQWQRAYAGKDPATVRRVYRWSVFLTLPFILIPTLLGVFASVHLPGIDPDTVLFQLMKQYLPTGILGLGFAGILATVMSSIDSVLLAGATAVLKDIYYKIKPNTPEHQTLNLLRFFTALYGIIGLGVALLIPDIIQLSLLGAFVVLTLVPAVIGGFAWSRGTAKGAVSSIVGGVLTLAVSYPLISKIAFIPSIIVGTVLYVVVSIATKRTQSLAQSGREGSIAG